MNQEKTGRFIALCRKEKGYTQAVLAEKLGVTDKAVSKWENGKSMPDTSILLELCNLLSITVNELLTGERIRMEQYTEKAEANLLELQELITKRNEKSLKNEKILFTCSALSYCIMCLTAVAFVKNPYWQAIIIVLAVLLFGASFYVCYRIEREVGTLVCPNCNAERKATGYDVLMSPHILRKAMKCPACGKRGIHARVTRNFSENN